MDQVKGYFAFLEGSSYEIGEQQGKQFSDYLALRYELPVGGKLPFNEIQINQENKIYSPDFWNLL